MKIHVHALSLLALALLVSGCGGGYTPTPSMPDDQASRSPGFGSSDTGLFGDGAAEGEDSDAPKERKPEDGPYIYEIWLHPDPPVASKTLRCDPRVDNPAGATPRLDYRWFVNGEELHGRRSDTLAKGSFTRDDLVSVEVTAIDINKRSDTFRLDGIQVSNSTPQIVNSLGMQPKLDGLAFQAKDPDGDRLTWRVEGAPPGVSIDKRSGVMSVDVGTTFREGDYSMTIYATDPAGGEGQMSFSARLGGSKAATQVKVEVKDAELARQSTFSDEEYIERTEKFLEKMDDMTEEEFEDYLRRSEEAAKELEAVGATEIPGGEQPPPYPGMAPGSND